MQPSLAGVLFILSSTQVISVRLICDKGGRMKGFGYAEFGTVQDLVDALSLTGRVCLLLNAAVIV